MEGVDCCYEPVHRLEDVPEHPQIKARQMLRRHDTPTPAYEILFPGWDRRRTPAAASARRLRERAGRARPLAGLNGSRSVMTIDKDTVVRIARLSRIAMEDDALEPMAQELNGILAWVEQLGEVDTEGVEPMTRRHRRDAPATGRPAVGRRADRRLAPPTRRKPDDNFFVVPRGGRMSDLTALTIAGARAGLAAREVSARGAG